MYCLTCVFPPGKRSVIFAEDSRNRLIIFPLECLYNQETRVLLILVKLRSLQTTCTRNLSIHIVGMGRSVTRDSSSCLSPARGPRRVRMYNASNLRKRLIKLQMGSRIRGRIVSSLNLISVQIHDYHVFRLQLIIVHTTWLDDKISALPVNSAYISPCKSDKPVFREIHVRLVNSLF